MADLREFLGIETLSYELANKETNYAIITYLDTLSTTEVSSKGELIQFNRPSYKGEVDLISASDFKKLMEDFPNSIKGSIVKYDNLENVASLCYDRLKEDYEKIGEKDSYCESKINILSSFFSNGKLVADHQDESSLNDLANKVFGLQEAVRDLQRNSLNKNNTHIK